MSWAEYETAEVKRGFALAARLECALRHYPLTAPGHEENLPGDPKEQRGDSDAPPSSDSAFCRTLGERERCGMSSAASVCSILFYSFCDPGLFAYCMHIWYLDGSG